MMSSFLRNNRKTLILRCTDKVAKRPQRIASVDQLKNGIPMFLDQLIKTFDQVLLRHGYDPSARAMTAALSIEAD